VIAVELINPYIQEMDKQGAWSDCDRCRRSFASVFMANLTIFQTVVAGDSWGLIAVPVIEQHPEVGLIFTGSLMTLVFGVLNLIVAVIVDTFAENRSKDVNSIAKELDIEEVKEKKTLGRIFERIDVDGDGALSYDELALGATRIKEFAQWLRVLDIDAEDLYQLFRIVDEDGSGEIDPQEFVNAMYRLKHTESKTATKLVKHIVSRLDVKHDEAVLEMTEHIKALQSTMTGRLTQHEEALRRYSSSGGSCPGSKPYEQEALERKLHEQEAAFEATLKEQEENIREALEAALGKASEVALEAALEAASDVVRNGQEQQIREALEAALGKAAEVALEAALEASAHTVRKAARSGRMLTEGVSARIDAHREVLAENGYDESWVATEATDGPAPGMGCLAEVRGPQSGPSQSPQEPRCGNEAPAAPFPSS